MNVYFRFVEWTLRQRPFWATLASGVVLFVPLVALAVLRGGWSVLYWMVPFSVVFTVFLAIYREYQVKVVEWARAANPDLVVPAPPQADRVPRPGAVTRLGERPLEGALPVWVRWLGVAVVGVAAIRAVWFVVGGGSVASGGFVVRVAVLLVFTAMTVPVWSKTGPGSATGAARATVVVVDDVALAVVPGVAGTWWLEVSDSATGVIKGQAGFGSEGEAVEARDQVLVVAEGGTDLDWAHLLGSFDEPS